MARVRRVSKNPSIQADLEFTWLTRDLGPEYLEWQVLAKTWIAMQPNGLADRIMGMRHFFKTYLYGQNLPIDPAVLLRKNQPLPSFYETCLPHTHGGVKWQNKVRLFIDWVLQERFSLPDDNDQLVVSPEYWNPIPYLSQKGKVVRTESVHSPLPYRYIVELRERLAPGKTFQDWKWAHTVAHGHGGVRHDWFEVNQDQVDIDDPDCVWRVRTTGSKLGNRKIFEIWSPVRAVALLVKLMIPLRTHQVRMLDSGEADTWRHTHNGWVLNKGPLAKGSKKRPIQHGVFRLCNDIELGEQRTSLYINTNKTADINKQGEMGYVIPWHYDELLYWLERLRDWQEKYNPLTNPISWKDLDHRHTRGPKSEYQLSKMPDTCFLFRDAAALGQDRFKPVIDDTLLAIWYRLLLDLENRCAFRKETYSEGKPLRFVEPNKNRTTLYPLHSLRVSLLTCLAVDAEVPIALLSKLVAGHSRVIMTLYYTKVGVAQMTRVLNEASDKLLASAEDGLKKFLAETEYKDLNKKIVINNMDGLKAVLPVHPNDRNPAGWQARGYGMCMVGGNTAPDEFNGKVGGCKNGGDLLRSNTKDAANNVYAAVPGGAGNCVRCRWFVTEPHYLDALRAHFNNISYHLTEVAQHARTLEIQKDELKAKRYRSEQMGEVFTDQKKLTNASLLWESKIAEADSLSNDLIATFRLMKRCSDLIENMNNDKKRQIVAVGALQDLKIVFESTSSELLQLAGICKDAELYPDENPGEAVIRRSQLMDSALYREGFVPIFMNMTKADQLKVGNQFMDYLSLQADPNNPELGLRHVTNMIESGRNILIELGLMDQWLLIFSTESTSRPFAQISDLTSQSLLDKNSGKQNGH